METNKEEIKKEVELKDEEMINPEDIVFDEESDADMPTPETANYDEPKKEEDTKILKPTFLFMKMFEECLGKMPYASILKNSNNDSIKSSCSFVILFLLYYFYRPNDNLLAIYCYYTDNLLLLKFSTRTSIFECVIVKQFF